MSSSPINEIDAIGQPIFLDYHSTTPVDRRVFAAMEPFFCSSFGNASSAHHAFGWQAEEAVERGRQQVAALINAEPSEIVFASGATEAINLALRGVAAAAGKHAFHIITCCTEHRAVLDTCRDLEEQGIQVTYLPVGPNGHIALDSLTGAIGPHTKMVSLMHANNEIGLIHPIDQISKICRRNNLIFHCDAAQSAGKIKIDVKAIGADLLSLSAHKFYGPKGVGALFIRRRKPGFDLRPQITGGGHQSGYRAGTLNVPGIVGMGHACSLCMAEMESEGQRLAELRDRLLGTIQSSLSGVAVNGSMDHRLPHNLNLSIDGIEAESLLMSLDDIALSSGSACSTATQQPSHVLLALGLGYERAHSSIRIGLGRFTTDGEIERAAGRIIAAVGRLRLMSPL